MFCTKCGAPMTEGQRFCGNCGAPAELFTPAAAQPEPEALKASAPSFTNPDVQPPEPPVPPTEPKKPRKKGKAGGWILGVLAVLVIAAAALAIFRWNAVSAFAANLTAKTFSSPEEYYQRVEKNNIQRGLDAAEEGEGVFALYREAADTRAKDKGFFVEEKLQLSFDESALSEQVLDLIEDELGMDISWLKNVGFYLSVGAENDLLGGSMTAFLNDKDIIDADYALDNASGDVFFTVPRLSGQAIRVNLQEMSGSGLSAEEQAAARELAETLMDEKLITTLIDRYSEIVIGDLTKVEKGTQELTAGGLSGKYTALEVKIDGKVMLKIAKDVLKKAQNDAEVEKLVCAVLKSRGMSEAAAKETFETEVLGWMENTMTELEEKDPKEITDNVLMTVYVDGQGRIIGRDIKLREDKNVVSEFSYAAVLKGLNYGLHAEFFMDQGWEGYKNEKTVVFDGGGKASLNKEITGSFDLRYKTYYGSKDDETKNDMKVLKIGLEAAAHDKGLTYEITATPQKDALNRVVEKIGTMPDGVEDLLRSLSGACSGEIKNGNSSLKMTLKSNKKELGSMSLDAYRVEEFSVSRPADAVEPYEWAAGLDFSKLQDILKDLMDAGLPASLLGDVGSLL